VQQLSDEQQCGSLNKGPIVEITKLLDKHMKLMLYYTSQLRLFCTDNYNMATMQSLTSERLSWVVRTPSAIREIKAMIIEPEAAYHKRVFLPFILPPSVPFSFTPSLSSFHSPSLFYSFLSSRLPFFPFLTLFSYFACVFLSFGLTFFPYLFLSLPLPFPITSSLPLSSLSFLFFICLSAFRFSFLPLLLPFTLSSFFYSFLSSPF